MTVIRTGSATSIANANDSWSQSITVPADAQCVVVIVGTWTNQDNWMGANPFTLGGSALTPLQKTDTQHGQNQLWLGYLVNPPTGSQTLACTWGRAPDSGANVTVVFYKDLDTGDPIRSSGQQLTDGTDLTGLTASAGDMMVGGVSSDTSITVTDNSQTQIYNGTGAGQLLAVAEKDGGTGFYFSNGSFTTVVALVLRAASTGTTISVTDTGAGSDAVPTIGVSLSLADSGAGADSLPGTAASLPLTDAGSGSETTQITAGLTLADAGAGVDSLAQVLVGLLLGDSLVGSETVSILADLVLSDAGGGAETTDISASLLVADEGAGVDALDILQELLKSVEDSGAGVDTIGGIQVSLSVDDNGAGGDALTISAQISVSDQGAAEDLVNLLTEQLVQIFDGGSGTETLTVSVGVISLADAGAGSDELTAAVELTITDTGAGADLISVLQSTMILISDLGTGTDAIERVDVSLHVADSGSGVETIAQVLASLMVTDLGAGVDVAVHYDVATRIFRIVFTIARPILAFSLSTCAIAFSLAWPSVEFELQEAS